MAESAAKTPLFHSYRSPVVARRGMIASSQPLASQAGLSILMKGGNAADAAIAMAAALNVTEPASTGLGGDCFSLFYDAATKKITALNGSGRAPAGLSIGLLSQQHLINERKSLIADEYHPHNITVPGACGGWCAMAQQHGTMKLADIFAPAIELAENGFPVAPLTAHFWSGLVARRLASTLGGSELLIDGRGPKPGEIFRNPGLAKTLRTIADGGPDAYYRGEIGRAVAETIQKAGGVMSIADLAAHETTWHEPIGVDYRGVKIWECPPNGQGIAALLALNILEGFDVASIKPESADRWHLLIEAMRVAFADTSWYVADPKFSKVPVAELLSKEYAAQRRKLIDPKKATLDTKHGAPVASSGTVYFCVVDGHGNACSFINSNYLSFGTGIVPSGFGFALQNRGNCFSTDPNHPNALAPRKRPYHTIIPGMITRPDGSLWAPFGVMGGFMQPQGHMQVAVALMDDHLDVQEALNRPRFCIEPAAANGVVSLEDGISPEAVEQLEKMGHPIKGVITGYMRALFGRGQIIRRESDGVLWAGSDPRADGCAMGY
jgi:gamma-glutamyltranspeptidase / glutathione hydrolase